MSRSVEPLVAELTRADANLLALQLKALANPVRLFIISLLAKNGEMVARDICEHIPLVQTTVSHHLRILRVAGLVGRVRQGVFSWYSLQPKALALVVGELNQFAPPKRRR